MSFCKRPLTGFNLTRRHEWWHHFNNWPCSQRLCSWASTIIEVMCGCGPLLSCLIKWLEKSDWLQGWCIIDEWAWLIENILHSGEGCCAPKRARVCVCVCVAGVSGFILCEQLNQLMHCTVFLIVILHRHTLPNIYCICNHKHGRCKLWHSHKRRPGGCNNPEQSAECQLILNISGYLCQETEGIVHLVRCLVCTCDTGWVV